MSATAETAPKKSSPRPVGQKSAQVPDWTADVIKTAGKAHLVPEKIVFGACVLAFQSLPVEQQMEFVNQARLVHARRITAG